MKFPRFRRRDIDDELRAHLQMAIRDRVDRGEDPALAEQRARREFGNVDLVRETTRDMWGGVWLERWAEDVRLGFRQMRRTPGFAVVALLTLALGIGASLTMTAVVDSVLLQPLPYREPARLYSLANLPPPGTPAEYWQINGRQFHEWRAHCRSCDDVAMGQSIALTLADAVEPVRLGTLSVSFNFFRTLGVQPALGRDFRAEEELPGNSRVLILSDAAWRAQFAGDPDVIGRTVRANGEPHVIVGVMPADFRLPVGEQWGPSGPPSPPMLFKPLGQDVSQASPAGNNNYIALVRLRPEVDASQATSELRALIAELVRQYAIQTTPVLLPFQETTVRRTRAGLLLLGAMVVAMLVIVCVNIGNLMLVRTADREREVAVRMALGSSRLHLFLLILNEAFALVVAGAIAGIACAYAGLKLFVAWAPSEIPHVQQIQIAPRIWLVAAALVAAATLLCGLLPAWRLARLDPRGALGSGPSRLTADRRKLRLREWLVGIEVALSTVLVVVGGLLAVSFARVLSAPNGFDGRGVVTQDLAMSGPRFNDAVRHRIIDDTLPRLAALPEISSAAVTSQLPLHGEGWICVVRDSARPDLPDRLRANYRFVSPDYWHTLGIAVRHGRTIEPSDRPRNIAVVSEAVARALWPGETGIGKRVSACGSTRPDSGLEVVGVVADVRAGVEKEPPFTVYEPYWTATTTRFFFAVRTRTDPQAAAAGLRRVLRAIDPELPVAQPMTMDDILDAALGARRFQMNLATGFALFALGLASLGIYGVISYAVSQRTPEFGIRLALGARPVALAATVVRQGMLPVFVGLAVGTISALMAGRFITSLLYAVSAHDPLTLAGVALLLTGVGICACWLPARRAMRINPLSAIRFE